MLNTEISILISKKHSTNIHYLEYSHSLLQYFIEKVITLFGTRFSIYNVHILIHLSDDVKNLGSLDENSAFQFENYMQVIKKHGSGKCPLTQLINRIDEHVRFNNIVSKKISKINIKYPNNIYLYEKFV